MKIIKFDGAALPNPGKMGIGVVLMENGNIVERISKKLPGEGTNNIAEYTALLTGLHRALELGWKEVQIEGDSKLVINQVKGLWQIKKEHLRPLCSEVKMELMKFDSYSIEWISRERNAIADKLATEALGYKEDPYHQLSSVPISRKPNESQEIDMEIDLVCSKCGMDCKFSWQEFKNGTKHIRKECPIHGFLKYVPQIEPYLKLAIESNSVTGQKNLHDFM